MIADWVGVGGGAFVRIGDFPPSQMLPVEDGKVPERKGFFLGDGTGVGKVPCRIGFESSATVLLARHVPEWVYSGSW